MYIDKKIQIHPTQHNLSKLQTSEAELQEKMIGAKSASEAKWIEKVSKESISSIYSYIY